MRKIILIFIIALAASLSLASVNAGLFGDDVNVKGVTVSQWIDSDKFNVIIVPNKDIEHINSISLKNVELKYPDQTYTFDSIGLRHSNDDADNKLFSDFKTLFKDYQFEFSFRLTDLDKVNRATNSYHVKGDIVVNTTTENNLVIGHVDADAPVTKSVVK